MKTLATTLATIIVAGFTSNSARASEPIEVLDAGNDVIVVVRGVTARPRIIPKGDKILIPLSGMPDKQRLEPTDDETIKRVEVRGTESRRIRLQLKADRQATEKIAERARLTQIGSGVQIVLPRDPYRVETTAAAAPTAAPTAADPDKGPALQGSDPTAAATPAAATTADAPAPAAELPAMEPEVDSAALPAQTDDGGPTSGLAGLVLGLLAMLGGAALIWQFRKRKSGLAGPINTIEILATQTLGPKNKVVWLAAGEREMLLSVGSGGATILEAWPRAAGHRAAASYNQVARAIGTGAPPHPPRAGTSPALRGLMELRDQHRGAYGPQPGSADAIDEFRAAEHEWGGANGTQLSRMTR